MRSHVAVIDRLAFGGNGVCRIDGKVCFVPFSCPGDEVRLNITSQKKSYCTAAIIELVSPSPLRVEPPCPIFGSCGGCGWQHISYPAQLEQKHRICADILWRGARVDGVLIADVTAAPSEYGYRSRVQLKLSAGNESRLQIGFFRHASHTVVDAPQGCPVALPRINDLMKRLRAVLPLFPEPEMIPEITLDAGEDGLIAVFRYTGKDTGKVSSFLIERSSDLEPCTGIYIRTGEKTNPERIWGNGEIRYRMPPRNPEKRPVQLTYKPGGFAQVNQLQNMALLSTIRRLGEFTGTECLLDLYCGNGNFSLPLAGEVASVVGVEGVRNSIDSAEANSASNDVSNAEFICLDVSAALRRFIREGKYFDVILLDPPRTGASDAVSDIARLNPGRIIYVSCDPATLARDCGLLAGYGYRVAEFVPIDMFPQTYHLESVTLLLKM